jgi:hypothetical protein
MKILVYINDSLGELDWIAPFIKSEEGRNFTFYIFLNGPGKSYEEKMAICQKYGFLEKNIHCLNCPGNREYYLFLLDNFMNRALGRVKMYSSILFHYGRKCVDALRGFFGKLKKVPDIEFDYIFRDYNLKESIMLQAFMNKSQQARIVVFPHAVGLQREHAGCPRESTKKVKADLWLENSEQSDLVKNIDVYKDIFFVSGVPAFDWNYAQKSLFDPHAKKAIVITRDCGLTFGFTYEEAYLAFDGLLRQLYDMQYTIKVKHHPRDNRLDEWRKIQAQYESVSELDRPLTEVNELYSACFTLFSTAPLFLLSRQIPVLEFSPYRKAAAYEVPMPMHYPDANGELTHDLLDFDLYARINVSKDMASGMQPDVLLNLSKRQYKQCQNIFPGGANKKIAGKLRELIDVR